MGLLLDVTFDAHLLSLMLQYPPCCHTHNAAILLMLQYSQSCNDCDASIPVILLMLQRAQHSNSQHIQLILETVTKANLRCRQLQCHWSPMSLEVVCSSIWRPWNKAMQIAGPAYQLFTPPCCQSAHALHCGPPCQSALRFSLLHPTVSR